MPVENLFQVVLYVLGCAVAIYIIAGFTVGCTPILPFLSILAAVGTFIATSYVLESGEPDMIWLPISTSILMMVFYKGSDFMNPRIDHNLYQLVSVERKWNSIFADFDDYELYFAPVATGGFIENTIFTGIMFGLYYHFIPIYFPDNWAIHAYTFYVAGMSLIDALGIIRIINFNQFFYGAIRILVIIGAVALGLIGPFTDDGAQRRESVFKQCQKVVAFDYSTSYYFDYEYLSYSNVYDETYFVYDATMQAGAQYSTWSGGKIFETIYAKDERLGDGTYCFNKYYSSELDFRYICEVDENDGPFKFFPLPSTVDYESYSVFTQEKYDHLGDRIYWNDSAKFMSITYNTIYDSSYDQENTHYSVTWGFNIDGDRNITSLRYISCTVWLNSANAERFTYTPYTGRDTELVDLFDEEDGYLIGYTYNPKEKYGVVLEDEFNALKNGNVANYDFKVKMQEGADTTVFIYDCETNTTAVYVNNEAKANNAYAYNDYNYYRPDYFINNNSRTMYDSEYNVIATNNSSSFKHYTYDDASASRAIIQGFGGYYSPLSEEESVWLNSISVSVLNRNADLDVYVNYNINIRKDGFGRCLLEDINASFTYEGRVYNMRLYKTDRADIVIPAV